MPRWPLLVTALIMAACGGSPYRDGPVSPTPTPGPVVPLLTAPTPQAPIDDVTVDTVRPVLIVANAGSDQPGEKLYEFQMAENPEFLGLPGSGVLSITRQGIPEGPDGKTVFQVDQDLPVPRRFYWRARAVQGALAWNGPYSEAARFKTAAAPKPVVRIASLTASSTRAEADADITLTASVENTDTPVDRLVFEWSADKGTFIGTGPRVRWRAPKGEKTPAFYDLKLTVVDKYVVVDADGNSEPRENRASAATRVTVNDSRAEITDLVLTFLGDFANSSVSPETCVRNFSDSCPGKREELGDIQNNRRMYTITGSRFSVGSITFADAMTWADVSAPCEFTSIIKATGKVEIARGTCLLTAVYENSRWWLCDSHIRGTTLPGFRFVF